MSLLKIDHLRKEYRRQVAVDDLVLELRAGEFVALIGPNGAGKSTTMKAIAGMIEPTSGTISIAGYQRFTQQVEVTREVGYVAQSPPLFPFLTGEETLRFVAESRGVSPEECETQIAELLELTALFEVRDQLVKEYSGGMAQKLAIACALIGNPSLLLLDESFVGLDPESTHRLQNRLKEHCAAGGAILLSSHILDMLEPLCTRFLMLQEGKIIEDLTQETLQQRLQELGLQSLLELYLHYRKI